MASKWAIQVDVRVNSSAIAGSTTTHSSLYFARSNSRLGGWAGYFWVTHRFSPFYPYPEEKKIFFGITEYGNFVYDTWYTLKIEVEQDGANLISRSYVDENLVTETSIVSTLSAMWACLDFKLWAIYASGSSAAIDADFDNFKVFIDDIESTEQADDFSGSSLPNWWIFDEGANGPVTNEEVGGVYNGDDTAVWPDGDKEIERRKQISLIDLGEGLKNSVVKNPITGELHHAYTVSDNGGTVKVQTFDPDSVTPEVTVDIATGIGTLTPDLEFDSEGKLVCLLSDGSFRYAAEDPRDVASWGAWSL